MKTKELTLQSERNRKRLIEIIYKAKAGHIGGDLSCLNVLTALYFDVMNVNADSPKDDLRDRFILSKGHCVEALYVTLESKGFITEGILDTLGQYGSILSGHPTIGVPGILSECTEKYSRTDKGGSGRQYVFVGHHQST